MDGGEFVALDGEKPVGGFQILGGRSESQVLPASFVHGCGVVDLQSGIVSHPNAANVVEDLCIWTTSALTDEHVAELVAVWFAADAGSSDADIDRFDADRAAIWRITFNVGSDIEFVGSGFSSSESPVGAISGAEFERVEIVNGKAYLGVSVYTNSEVEVIGGGVGGGGGGEWGRAEIEGAKVEDDGTVTLTVPATAEKGFMILKSKGK